jgi:hypothetical protein
MDRKASELRDMEIRIRALDLFNHRQVDVIRHALKHPYEQYTIDGHRNCQNVVYETARTDLLNLADCGVLEKKKKGKKIIFSAPHDLPIRLRRMGKDSQ